MATFLKKQNLTISTGEYEKDGKMKKEWRTIGELITMQGDDGQPYQFFKMWGAGGVVEGKVFEQRDNNAAAQQPQPQGYAQQPQTPPGYAGQQHPQNAAHVQPQGHPQHQAPQPQNGFSSNDQNIPF